jgi:hypothetical protein
LAPGEKELQDLKNEVTRPGHYHKEEYFFQGQANEVPSYEVGRGKPPDSLGGKPSIPGQEKGPYRHGGRQQTLPFADVKNAWFKSPSQGTQKNEEVEYEV